MSILWKNWAVHNLIAHPLMEILGWIGLGELGTSIHNATVPDDDD